MDIFVVFYAFGAFLVAAFLKGLTGMGFSTICLGILASLIDIKIAIPLAIIPSLSSNILVMFDAGRFREALHRFRMMYFCALPGLLAGLWLLGSVKSEAARRVLGIVLLLYGAWGLWINDYSLPSTVETWFAGPVGFATGLINGITGSQIMPILPYLLGLKLDRATLVQALNISFTASSIVMLFGLGKLGLLDWQKMGVSLLGVVPAAFGIWLGGKIRRTLPELLFRRIVFFFLICLGVSLAVR
jgi:uncharacterized membrane protein YfcA